MKSCAFCGRCANPNFVFAKSARDPRCVSGNSVTRSLGRRRFYTPYREQFSPDLTVLDSVVEEWISVRTFRAKEKITANPQQVVDWTFAGKSPPLIIKSKRSDPRDGSQKDGSLEGDRGAANRITGI
jgi:hypothetical protein